MSDPKQALATVADYVKSRESHLALVAPRGTDVKRMTNLALAAFSVEPRLWDCSKESVYLALHKACTYGLELTASGVYAQAFLVPRWNGREKCMEACFQVGYKGLRDLVMRSGKVRSLVARCVYACDRFEISYGDDERLIHVPDLGHEYQGDDAHMIGAYAIAKLEHGDPIREYWPRVRLERHREKYAAAKTKDGKIFGPWVDNFGSMCMKTMVIQVCRWLPIEEATAGAIHDDADLEPVAPTVVVAPASVATTTAAHPTGAAVKDKLAARRAKPEKAAEKEAQGTVVEDPKPAPEPVKQAKPAPAPAPETEAGGDDPLATVELLRKQLNNPKIDKHAALECARKALLEIPTDTAAQILRGHQFEHASEMLEQGNVRTAQRIVAEVCAELGV